MFGFLVLWVVLIVLGTFLRGPNWNFFGPFEHWDPHKVDPLNNVNLSRDLLGASCSKAMPIGGGSSWRDLHARRPGLILVLAYLLLLPPLLAGTVLRKFFSAGLHPLHDAVTLLLFMMALPIKMVLRWPLT